MASSASSQVPSPAVPAVGSPMTANGGYFQYYQTSPPFPTPNAPASSTMSPAPVPAQAPRLSTASPINSQMPSAPGKAPSPAGRQSPVTTRNQDLKTTQEYRDLTSVLRNVPDDVVRQVLGSTISQATPAILNRIIDDFGDTMVKTSKHQIVKHLSAQDLDELSDAIMSRASPQFLDKALARRLETIDARSLVNALARAERLGYDVQDIVEEAANNGPENVIASLPDAADGLASQHDQPYPSSHPGWPQGTPVSSQQWQGSPAGFPPQARPQAQPQAVVAQSSPQIVNVIPPTALSQWTSLGLAPCNECGRPCSGPQALEYHGKKNSCDPSFSMNKIGKSICPHCGCAFGSLQGVQYHMKSKVCGVYPQSREDQLMQMLQVYKQYQASYAQTSVVHPPPPTLRRVQPVAPATPTSGGAPMQGVLRLVNNNSLAQPDSNSRDMYAHLTMDARARFEREMALAEEKYGGLIREATTLSEPERSNRLARLKNSYNTKQSVTRKKYGIRLRERRTKAEIEGERTRLFGTPNGNEIWREVDRAKETPSGSQGAPTASQATTSTPSRQKVPLPERAGLAGSGGPAETQDPTAYLTSSQPRGLAQLQQSQTGTHDDPMAIDDESEKESEVSTDSDTEDIPAN